MEKFLAVFILRGGVSPKARSTRRWIEIEGIGFTDVREKLILEQSKNKIQWDVIDYIIYDNENSQVDGNAKNPKFFSFN